MSDTNSESPKSAHPYAAIWATVFTSIFIIVCIFGEGWGGSFGANGACSPYMGCTAGFFGYDAIEHFLFGISAIWILIWVFQKFPQYSVLGEKRWKNILILIALVVLISVFWEFLECAHDYFRLEVLHQPLLNLKLHINYLDQPTNLDTMGDLTFGLVGAVVALFFTKF